MPEVLVPLLAPITLDPAQSEVAMPANSGRESQTSMAKQIPTVPTSAMTSASM